MSEKSILEMVLPDPVLSAFELPLRARFYPFGFPLDLATNSDHVMQAAEEGWGPFMHAIRRASCAIASGVAPEGNDPLPPQSDCPFARAPYVLRRRRREFHGLRFRTEFWLRLDH